MRGAGRVRPTVPGRIRRMRKQVRASPNAQMKRANSVAQIRTQPRAPGPRSTPNPAAPPPHFPVTSLAASPLTGSSPGPAPRPAPPALASPPACGGVLAALAAALRTRLPRAVTRTLTRARASGLAMGYVRSTAGRMPTQAMW